MPTSRRFLPDLRRRRVAPELMDDPALEPADHRAALRGLARLNALGGATRLLWTIVRGELAREAGQLRVLDVACGSGDVLSALVRRGGGRLRGLGLDVSPVAIAQAAAGAPDGADFEVRDVLDPTQPLPVCDVALCSLFLHHLSEEQAAALLARMAAAARRLVIVSDLERSATSWWLVWAGAHLVTRSHVVHRDSATSVEAAWTTAEMLELARRAGLTGAGLGGAAVRRSFPARLVLEARPGRSLAAESDEGGVSR